LGATLGRTAGNRLDPEARLLELGLAAKSMCSAIHVSGRRIDETIGTSIRPTCSDGAAIAYATPGDGRVIASAGDLAREAVFAGDAGGVLLPLGAGGVYFEQRPLPDVGEGTIPFATDPAFDAAVRQAFAASPDTMTASVAIWHRGQIVAEAYGRGAHRAMRLESWSMGKSIVAIMIARAVALGLLTLDEPLGLKEWSDPCDPRHAITVAHALRMSSGLDFSAPWALDFDPARHGYPDHGFIYSGAVDIRALAASRPLRHPPGSFGAYKNGDTLLLLAALEDRLDRIGVPLRRWIRHEVLEPAGAGGIVIETDPYGNPFCTGNVFGRALDWVALARLFLPGEAQRSGLDLDAEVLAACLSPTPAWRGSYGMAQAPEGFSDSIYGGHVWLNRHAPGDRWPAPDDTAFFLGVGGQYAFIVPSLDLVVVRMGHVLGMTAQGAGRGHVPGLLRLACEAARRS
jgi:CubicO group peptidase (beta-lactamase class C family)